MNTNDFYKELFEKYALDEEKIRRNAIKAAKTPAWQRAVSAHWKTAVGAAAAVAVTVGAVAYTVGNGAGNVIDIDSSDDLLTATQRLREAEKDYYNADTQDESRSDIYVTFTENLCYSDMSVALSALSEYDEISVESLYLIDGSVIRSNAAVCAYAESGASVRNIAGAKLNAPLKCFKDINDLSKVSVAEKASDKLNDDTFSPLKDEDPLKYANDFIVTTASAAETTTPFVFATETSVSTSVSGSYIPADTDADTTEPVEDSEPDEDTDMVDTPIDITDEETTENTEDDIVEVAPVSDDGTDFTTVPAETTVSADDLTEVPDIGLYTQIYQLNVENALETILIRDHAIVLTRGEAYIFKLGGVVNAQARVYDISVPKLAYSDDDTVILTGCGDNGRRNTLLVLDMKRDKVYFTDAGTSFGEAEIGTINYSSAEDKYFLKAVSESNTFFYELVIGGETELSFRPLFEFSGVVSPAGYRNGKLWFTAADEKMKYGLYCFDCVGGSLDKTAAFGTVCKVRRSRSLESFIMTASDPDTDAPVTYVFDTNTAALIPVKADPDAQIAVMNGVIYIGSDGKNYTLSANGELTETNARVMYAYYPAANYGIVASDSEKVIVAEQNHWKSR